MPLQPGDDADALHLPRVVKRGKRETAVTTITTETGIIRLDDIQVVAGHLYGIYTSPINVDATNAGNIGAVRMRHRLTATPGNPATIANGQLQNYIREYQDDATNSNVVPFMTFYPATLDGYLSLLLTAIMHAGTGSIQVFCSTTDVLHFVVCDLGPDPGDEAVLTGL